MYIHASTAVVAADAFIIINSFIILYITMTFTFTFNFHGFGQREKSVCERVRESVSVRKNRMPCNSQIGTDI